MKYNRGFVELLVIGIIGVLALLGAYYLSKTYGPNTSNLKIENSR